MDMKSGSTFMGEAISVREVGRNIAGRLLDLRYYNQHDAQLRGTLFHVLYDAFCRNLLREAAAAFEGHAVGEQNPGQNESRRFLSALLELKDLYSETSDLEDRRICLDSVQALGGERGYEKLKRVLLTSGKSMRRKIRGAVKELMQRWYRTRFPGGGDAARGRRRDDYETFFVPLGENVLDAVISRNVIDLDSYAEVSGPDPPKRYNSYHLSRGTLLHLAVAFCAAPSELDRLLMAYGYHPLHIRKLFDVAVRAVLSERQAYVPDGEAPKNPFQSLRIYYENLIQATEPDASEMLPLPGSGFRDDSTWLMRHVWGNELPISQALTFVAMHRASFTGRRKRLLAEYARLTGEYRKQRRRMKDALHCPESGIESGDLYAFFRKYCQRLQPASFQRQLSSLSNSRRTYHPTREWCVILWIWDFCRQWDPYAEFPPDFLGEELIWTLNEHLNAFDWPVLNEHRAFDFVILQLFAPLSVQFCANGRLRKAYYAHKPLTLGALRDDSFFSTPFQIILQLLNASGSLPLACDCRELM